jgi:hypothetical protein
MAGRDSQDIPLPVTQPTTAHARDSQDLILPVTETTTAHARDSQDIPLPVAQPSTANARDSQDLLLFLMLFLGARNSQDLTLPVAQPSTALARVSQDIILYIRQNVTPTPVATPCYGYYLSLITSEYQNSPLFLQWLAAPLQMLCDAQACINSLPAAFNVNTAVGVQLDAIGVVVGVSRTLPFQPTGGNSPVLGDGNYRILLMAKIAQNQWDGQIGSLWGIWQSLFPGGTIYVIDNQNMTATVILAGGFNSIIQQMIQNGLIVPRPETVEYFYTFATLPIFGFDGVNPSFIAGFDIGHFA